MKLSILIPVYNERAVVRRSLARVLEAPLPEDMDRELIVVDDCSKDGTGQILEELARQEPRIRLFRHAVNQGKGAAVRTAIQHAEGDFCVVQDADLEYDPFEYGKLLRPLLDGRADAVFGSRYLSAEQTRVLPFWHTMLNKFLTLVSNMFSNLKVTDMETCYKVFRADLLKSIPIRSDRFGFEPEITMKAAKRKIRIYEVPVSYHGRTYEEGKKISWWDGVKVFAVLLRYWLIDDLYAESYGRGMLNTLTGTPRYVSWIVDEVRPHLGDTVLEVGAGIGNFAGRLMARRELYIAGEGDALYLHALRNRFLRTPNVDVRKLDPNQPADFDGIAVDTALALNVLEYTGDAARTLAAIAGTVKPGGTLVLLAPQGTGLYCRLDERMGSKRRFDEPDLRSQLAALGFEVTRVRQINRLGRFFWFVNGKVLRRSQLNKLLLKLFDWTVWIWRRFDFVLPWKGLTLILVARKTGAQQPVGKS